MLSSLAEMVREEEKTTIAESDELEGKNTYNKVDFYNGIAEDCSSATFVI